MSQFIIEYEVGQASYTCKGDAVSFDDAERHLLGIAASGRVLGMWLEDVPLHDNDPEDQLDG